MKSKTTGHKNKNSMKFNNIYEYDDFMKKCLVYTLFITIDPFTHY